MPNNQDPNTRPPAHPGTQAGGPGGATATDLPAGAHDLLAHFLEEFGLGTLTDYAWGLMQDGVTQDQVMLYLYDRPEFQERFPALAIRRENGLPPISPAEYVALEGTYRQIMHASGLPANFYDEPGDYTALIAGDVSPAEVQTRVEQGFQAVSMAPPEVRDAFSAYFGVTGDGALASMFLDQNRAVPALLDMVARAQVGGAGSMLGFEITSRAADELVDFGVDFNAALQGFRALADAASLFRETIGEGQAHLQPAGTAPPPATRAVTPVGGTSRIVGGERPPLSPTDQGGGGAGEGGDRPGQPTRPEPLPYPDRPPPPLPGTGGGPGSLVGPDYAEEGFTGPNDLRASVEGLAWIFGTDPELRRRVERRRLERAAAFAGGGSPLVNERGTGLGRAY